MCAHPVEGAKGGEPTLAELLRLARTHQGMAQDLLARAERISCSNGFSGATERPELDGVVRGNRWRFTEREKHVAELLVKGMSNRRIARSLVISERTVKNHLHSIFYKLGVGDRTQAVIMLMRGQRPR